MQELLTQVDHCLTILSPEALKDLRSLDLNGGLVKLLNEFSILSIALSQLTLLRCQLLVDITNFAVKARILARQLVQLVPQIVQIDQAVLLGIG